MPLESITRGYTYGLTSFVTSDNLNDLGIPVVRDAVKVVSTRAALKALTVADYSDGEVVRMLAVTTYGDGGGGEFRYTAASSATDDGGIVIAPNTGSGRWVRVFTGAVNARWFGAMGDGSADDTSSLQAAIAYCSALRGTNDDTTVYPCIYIPTGVYKVTSTLTVQKSRITIYGDGPKNSVITRTGDFGDTLKLIPVTTGGTNSVGSCTIREIGFYADSEPTTGAAIHLSDCREMTLENLHIENTFGGIRFVGGGTNKLDGVEINIGKNFTTFRSGSYGVLVESSPTHSYPNATFESSRLNVQGFNVYADVGIWIKSADGVWLNNGHAGGFLYNLHIYGTSSASIQGVYCTQYYFDGFFTGNPTLENIRIENDGTATMQTYSFIGCEIVGASYNSATPHRGCNVRVRGSITNVRFSSCHIAYAGAIGFWINTGTPKSFTIDGCTIRRNAQVTSIQEVLIEGTASGVTVVGTTIGEVGYTASASGPLLVQSSANNILVQGCQHFGFGSNTITDSTSGITTNRYIGIGTDNDATILAIPSASTLALRAHGDTYTVALSNNISNVSGQAWLGRRVSLVFTTSLTVSSGSNLAITGGTFAATADDVLTIVYNGTKWVEASRAIN
jgi:hypothetical protein